MFMVIYKTNWINYQKQVVVGKQKNARLIYGLKGLTSVLRDPLKDSLYTWPDC